MKRTTHLLSALACLCGTLAVSTLASSGHAAARGSCHGAAVGTPLAVAGHSDRPTRLQLAASPTAPLIVMFHGKDSCLEYLQNLQTTLDTTGTAMGVSILWVSGTPSTPGSAARTWDGWGPGRADTYSYLRAAVAAARAAGVARTAKVIAAGISMGGGMALWAQCTLPDVFSGVVSIAGWSGVPCGRINRSLLVIGGTGDSSSGANTPSIVSTRWLANSATCPHAAKASSAGAGKMAAATWANCENHAVVRIVVLHGVGHVWPVPPVTPYYNADRDIVRFAYAIAAAPVKVLPW